MIPLGVIPINKPGNFLFKFFRQFSYLQKYLFLNRAMIPLDIAVGQQIVIPMDIKSVFFEIVIVEDSKRMLAVT